MQLPILMSFAYAAAFPPSQMALSTRLQAVVAALPLYLLAAALLLQMAARRALRLGAETHRVHGDRRHRSGVRRGLDLPRRRRGPRPHARRTRGPRRPAPGRRAARCGAARRRTALRPGGRLGRGGGGRRGTRRTGARPHGHGPDAAADHAGDARRWRAWPQRSTRSNGWKGPPDRSSRRQPDADDRARWSGDRDPTGLAVSDRRAAPDRAGRRPRRPAARRRRSPGCR